MIINKRRLELFHHLQDVKAKIKINELKQIKYQAGDWGTPGLPGARCSYEDGILRFEVDEKLPLIKQHTENVRNLWISRMVYAYQKLNINVFYGRAFCLIKVSNKNNTYWDVDNLAYKYVIDALRAMVIVKDDNFKNLSLCIMGEKCDYNKTEIVVLEHNHLDDFLKSLLVC